MMPEPNETYMTNRNPRNLELMKIGYKPNGWFLEAPVQNFWHRLAINKTSNGVLAQVIHHRAGSILQASTAEWPIKQYLYRANDTSAYINLARVFAQRCIEAGIYEMECAEEATPASKLAKFLETVEANGIALKESERYVKHHPNYFIRMEKPWEVIVD